MRASDLDPVWLQATAAVLGVAMGFAATRAADLLPARYGVRELVSAAQRRRRNAVVVLLATATWLAIARILAHAGDVGVAHGALLLVTNGVAATCAIAAAAIDLEHMILPNELTLGATVLCLVTSPVRAIGLTSSLVGAASGLAIALVPLFLYQRLRGRSGLGLGDAKLALMAGAWHGLSGVPFVLALGAVQMIVAAGILRILGISYPVPASVRAELEDLRARADAGDAEARRELEADPLSTAPDGALTTPLPFGPFLALGCVEVLFLRRWLLESVVVWLAR